MNSDRSFRKLSEEKKETAASREVIRIVFPCSFTNRKCIFKSGKIVQTFLIKWYVRRTPRNIAIV